MSTDDKKSIPLALARRQRELLGEVLKTTGQITVDALLDTLAALYAECVKLDSKQGNIQSFVQRCMFFVSLSPPLWLTHDEPFFQTRDRSIGCPRCGSA